MKRELLAVTSEKEPSAPFVSSGGGFERSLLPPLEGELAGPGSGFGFAEDESQKLEGRASGFIPSGSSKPEELAFRGRVDPFADSDAFGETNSAFSEILPKGQGQFGVGGNGNEVSLDLDGVDLSYRGGADRFAIDASVGSNLEVAGTFNEESKSTVGYRWSGRQVESDSSILDEQEVTHRALAQGMRSDGRFEEVDELLHNVGTEALEYFDLEYFDDQIRTNPAMFDSEQMQNVDDTRKNLYANRASILKEVDRAWESDVSSLSNESGLETLEQLIEKQEQVVAAKRKIVDPITQYTGVALNRGEGLETAAYRKSRVAIANRFEIEKKRDALKFRLESLDDVSGNELARLASEVPVENNGVTVLYEELLAKRRELNMQKAKGLSENDELVSEQKESLERLEGELTQAVSVLHDSLTRELEVSEKLLAEKLQVEEAKKLHRLQRAEQEYQESLRNLRNLRLQHSTLRVAALSGKSNEKNKAPESQMVVQEGAAVVAFLRDKSARSLEESDSFSGVIPEVGDLPELSLRELFAENGLTFSEQTEVRIDEVTGELWFEGREDEKEVFKAIVSHFEALQEGKRELENKEIVSEEEEEGSFGEVSAAKKGDSTFSLNVSDVSYQLASEALGNGKWPETVRVEEFVNHFDYGEPEVALEDRVSVAMEQAAHPYLSQRNLLRVSLKTAAAGRSQEVPLGLTLLLDNSGSMVRQDRAAAVAEVFAVLQDQLKPGDRVNMIAFSRQPRLLAEGVDGGDFAQLVADATSLNSEGGTNLESALTVAKTKALEHFVEGAQNRIVLLTDGIANLGNEVPEELSEIIVGMREEGLGFDVCGVGAEGINDRLLASLAQKGDGRYFLLSEAGASGEDFANQLAGALRPAAKNVKVQVEWNPARVNFWRLYGYEEHQLAKEDFRNDQVDAAEMAAAEEGVALYHVEPKTNGIGPIGVARVRFFDVESGRMVEREWEIPYREELPTLAEADAKIHLAAAAALVGEKLAQSPLGERFEWGELSELTSSLQVTPALNSSFQISTLQTLVEQARALEN